MARETESEEATPPPILSKEEETEAAFWSSQVGSGRNTAYSSFAKNFQ